MQGIGAQAVNQAIKAIAIARSYLEEDNLDLSVQPSFVKLILQDDERTAIKLRVVVEYILEDETEENTKKANAGKDTDQNKLVKNPEESEHTDEE